MSSGFPVSSLWLMVRAGQGCNSHETESPTQTKDKIKQTNKTEFKVSVFSDLLKSAREVERCWQW